MLNSNFFLFILFPFILSSCTSFTELEDSQSNNDFVYQPPSQQSKARQVVTIPDNWKLRGKIAIIAEEENWYANYLWSKQSRSLNEESRKLVFTGPLGETQMELTQIKQGETEFNRLAMGGEVYTDFTLNQLLSQQFGFEVPIIALEYWIFGQINPKQTFQVKSLSQSGQLLEIKQHEWNILYSYQSLKSHFPKKVVAQNKDYKIKMYIRHRKK